MKEFIIEIKGLSNYTFAFGLFTGAVLLSTDALLIFPYILGVLIGALLRREHNEPMKEVNNR